MRLYHITTKQYNVDDIISIGSFKGTTHYHSRIDEKKKQIDNRLSEQRPEGEPSRSKCIYAFKKSEYCYYFGEKEYPNKELHLYECEGEVTSVMGHPMVLVNSLKDTLSEDIISAICSEYWSPQRNDWNYMEFLLSEIRINKEVAIDQDLKLKKRFALMEYMNDIDTANDFINHIGR